MSKEENPWETIAGLFFILALLAFVVGLIGAWLTSEGSVHSVFETIAIVGICSLAIIWLVALAAGVEKAARDGAGAVMSKADGWLQERREKQEIARLERELHRKKLEEELRKRR